jgi:hypothetical protein
MAAVQRLTVLYMYGKTPVKRMVKEVLPDVFFFGKVEGRITSVQPDEADLTEHQHTHGGLRKLGWMGRAGVVSGLVDDAIDVFILAERILFDFDEVGNRLEGDIDRRRDALAIFYEAAKKLAATDLATLKAAGVETTFSDGGFAFAMHSFGWPFLLPQLALGLHHA